MLIACGFICMAAFFALRYTWLAGALARHLAARVLLVLVSAGLALYTVVGLAWPVIFGGLARFILVGSGGSYSYDYVGSGFVAPPPSGTGYLPYAIVGTTVALFLFAAYRQMREFARGRQPMQGALAVAFLLLAQAQISQILGPVWTLAWWEYHGLMLSAVVLALGALFVELDRRRGLERFLPPNVVTRVIAGDRLNLGGERAVVTILFADLRGSTALAERLEPEAVVGVLNAYLRVMAGAVIDAGGILDKFLGDGLMGIFGVLDERGHESNGASDALRAAALIRERVTALSRARAERGEPLIEYGVGVHTGAVVLGVIGLPERSDYTAIGDAVNTASRMESLTKELGVDIVLSSDTAELAAGAVRLRPLGDAQVRGKVKAISTFTIAFS